MARNTKRSIGGLLLVGLGVLGCVVAGFAGDRASRSPQVDGREAPRISLVHATLPYQGYGSVHLLDDGALIIDVGGEETTNQDGESVFEHVESIGFQLPSNTQIVRIGDRVTVDRANRSSAARTAENKGAVITSLPETANNGPVSSVYAFSGKMTLELNETTGVLALSIRDQEKSGWTFEMQADAFVPETSKAQSESSAKSGFNGPVGFYVESLPLAAGCYANCTGGNCTINCGSGQTARCWCEGSTANCRCIG